MRRHRSEVGGVILYSTHGSITSQTVRRMTIQMGRASTRPCPPWCPVHPNPQWFSMKFDCAWCPHLVVTSFHTQQTIHAVTYLRPPNQNSWLYVTYGQEFWFGGLKPIRLIFPPPFFLSPLLVFRLSVTAVYLLTLSLRCEMKFEA